MNCAIAGLTMRRCSCGRCTPVAGLWAAAVFTTLLSGCQSFSPVDHDFVTESMVEEAQNLAPGLQWPAPQPPIPSRPGSQNPMVRILRQAENLPRFVLLDSIGPLPERRAPEESRRWQQYGQASWYGPGFHGRRTASGEVYDQMALTAAHPTLPFGTMVRVTNLATGRSVVVRINDRGPFSRERTIDLSRGAARKLGMENAGISWVKIEALE